MRTNYFSFLRKNIFVHVTAFSNCNEEFQQIKLLIKLPKNLMQHELRINYGKIVDIQLELIHLQTNNIL